MTATALLAHLSARGVRVRVEGECLRLAPRDALTPELLAEVREHKPQLLALLDPERVGDRLRAAFAAWREHVSECPACEGTDPRHRCDEGRRLDDVYHAAWRGVYVVPFADVDGGGA